MVRGSHINSNHHGWSLTLTFLFTFFSLVSDQDVCCFILFALFSSEKKIAGSFKFGV